MTKPYHKKWHEPCIIFLDDCFASDKAIEILKPYFQLEDFRNHFRDPHKKGKASGISDRPVIELCHKEKWLLLTFDHEMQNTHVEDIKRNPDFTAFAAANNPSTPEEHIEWLHAVVKVRATILRYYKKKPRPWFAVFTREGNISSFRTITEEHTTRRTRPK